VTTPSFPCARCGATLQYAPGTVSLTCPYCKSTQPIPRASADTLAAAVEGQDLETALRAAADEHTTEEVLTVKCGSCGAESSFAKNVTADRCSFCGTPLVAEAQSKKAFRPKALLPFKIAEGDAGARFRAWVKRLWFAPNRIKKEAAAGRIDGVYLPFWTYDCETLTSYRGQRGDDSTVQETDARGQTRSVTRTQWTRVSGSVACRFDDVLVPASGSLPQSYVAALEPWDLQALVPYADSYLSGFRTESYALDLKSGFDVARGLMEQRVRSLIARDIGGDHQRIESLSTSYSGLTFKHVLLPVWISSYRFRAKVYRFLVNGRTGEVQGERPWSWIKILLAVIAALAVIALLARLSH
jgi:hypothetical protein